MRKLGLRPHILPAAPAPAQRRLERLTSWSTAHVAKRAQRRFGWSDTRRRAVEREYRRFLTLIAIEPATSYGMAPCEVDDLWHEHLMDTRDYLAMCHGVFGMVIHHCPLENEKPRSDSDDHYQNATLPRLREVFGTRPGHVWPKAGSAASFSQCCNHLSGNTPALQPDIQGS